MNTYEISRIIDEKFLNDWIVQNGCWHGNTLFRQDGRHYYRYVSDKVFDYELSFSCDNPLSPSMIVDVIGMPNFIYWNINSNTLNHIFYINSYSETRVNTAWTKTGIEMIKYGFFNEDLDIYVIYIEDGVLKIDILNEQYEIVNSYEVGGYSSIYNVVCKKYNEQIYFSFGYLNEGVYLIRFLCIDGSSIIYDDDLPVDNVAFFDIELLGNNIEIFLYKNYTLSCVSYSYLISSIVGVTDVFYIPASDYFLGLENKGYLFKGLSVSRHFDNIVIYLYGNAILKTVYSGTLAKSLFVNFKNQNEALLISNFVSNGSDIYFLNSNKLYICKQSEYVSAMEHGVLNYNTQVFKIGLINSSVIFMDNLGDGRDIMVSLDGKTFGYSSIDLSI